MKKKRRLNYKKDDNFKYFLMAFDALKIHNSLPVMAFGELIPGDGDIKKEFPQALEIMENLENHEKSPMHGKIMEFERKPLNNLGKIMEFCEII